MTKSLSILTIGSLLYFASGCSQSPAQLQKALEDNPEILVNAIKKNPEKIMAALQVAAQESSRKSQELAAKEEEAKIEAEFKNPLKPELGTRASLGLVNAPITIVEYTDFQCPFCARGYQTMELVRKTYGDKVRLVVKNLPLSNHPMAMPAAERFEALMLVKPDQAWAFYHEIFAHQDQLNGGGEKYLDSVVKKVGADSAKVKTLMASEKVQSLIRKDMEEAEKFSIQGTPGFIVAGVSVRGAYPFETFKQIIDRKLSELE